MFQIQTPDEWATKMLLGFSGRENLNPNKQILLDL